MNRYVGILLLLLRVVIPFHISAEPEKIPILYTTDLYHPHDDPDDHFDLATLFATDELDILGIVIDRGERGADRPATMAIEQMISITGREVPYALGLTRNLESPDDACRHHSTKDQAGVKLILTALRQADRPVNLFTTGSLRDVAAAYNREPELFKKKVGRFYINAGHSSGDDEWNVKLDRHAYVRMLSSDLPVYWMPCFGDDGFSTYWQFRHGEVLESLPLTVQNFFIYALKKTPVSDIDPIQALKREIPAKTRQDIWSKKRNMWCTAGFLHAANRRNDTFTFRKMPVRIDKNTGHTRFAEDADSDSVRILTFYRDDPERYATSMTTVLRDLLKGL